MSKPGKLSTKGFPSASNGGGQRFYPSLAPLLRFEFHGVALIE
ncbi:MAG: hypothetical protein EWM72_01520 [Nitrospira sp.]|nr:MAG: hypothetical protein EWM72_01520 [Nitrospira sp.]